MKDVTDLLDVFAEYRVIDLSHTLEEHMPSFPTHSKYFHELWESYWHGDRAVAYQLTMNEHSGTHVDAPAHFIRSEEDPAHYWVDELAVDTLIGRCLVIHFPGAGPGGIVTREDLAAWEEANVAIMRGDIVLLNFGWHKLWRLRPNSSAFLADWPGLGKSAADYLTEKAVRAAGTDAISLDAFATGDFPAHYTLLGQGIYIIENLANMDDLPPVCFFMAFPLKIKGGSASPVRAVALVPRA